MFNVLLILGNSNPREPVMYSLIIMSERF